MNCQGKGSRWKEEFQEYNITMASWNRGKETKQFIMGKLPDVYCQDILLRMKRKSKQMPGPSPTLLEKGKLLAFFSFAFFPHSIWYSGLDRKVNCSSIFLERFDSDSLLNRLLIPLCTWTLDSNPLGRDIQVCIDHFLEVVWYWQGANNWLGVRNYSLKYMQALYSDTIC